MVVVSGHKDLLLISLYLSSKHNMPIKEKKWITFMTAEEGVFHGTLNIQDSTINISLCVNSYPKMATKSPSPKPFRTRTAILAPSLP